MTKIVDRTFDSVRY